MASDREQAHHHRFKSLSGKRHNIDLVDSEMLNGLDYAWMANYSQRALLVRILRDPQDKKHARSQENRIKKVKFFTRKKDSHGTSEAEYNCSRGFQIYELENFYDYLNRYLKPFEQSEMSVKYWRDIVSCIELFDYRYEEHERVEYWSSSKNPKKDEELIGSLRNMSKEQKKYLSAFVKALETDMRNGHAKKWIEELIKIILLCFESDPSRPDVEGFAPVQYENTNTVLETVFGDSDVITEFQYSAPYFSTPLSNASSLLSLSSLHLESPECAGIAESSPKGTADNKVTRHTIVPDYCVALPDFPGIFPIVFELKPAYQESQAFVQNMQQMLSKLFFQDVVFGVVVSPRSFQLSAIIKTEGGLHFASTNAIPIIQYKNNVHMLNLKRLDAMCNFIYQVLKWAKTTKCLLKNQRSCEKEGDPQTPT